MRKREEPLLEKIDEKERGELQWREAYTDMKNKAEVERGYDLKKRLSDIQGDYSPKRRISRGSVLLFIVLVFVFVLVLFWMSISSNMKVLTNSTIYINPILTIMNFSGI